MPLCCCRLQYKHSIFTIFISVPISIDRRMAAKPNVTSPKVRPCSVLLERLVIDQSANPTHGIHSIPSTSNRQSFKHGICQQSSEMNGTNDAHIPSNSPITDDEGDALIEKVSVNFQHSKKREMAGSCKKNGKVNRNNETFSVKCCRHGCNELFENFEAMVHHVTVYHAKGIKNTFNCHECKKTLGSKWFLRQHMNSVHMGLRTYKCPFPNCSKSFVRNQYLKQHTNGVHTKSNTFKCQKCPRKFYYKSHLIRHLAYEHGKGNTHFCYLCKKKFAARHDLQHHMNAVHTRHIRFQCPIRSCSKIFAWKVNLNRHINAIHTKRNAFICTRCPKKFYEKRPLTRHLANKHGEGITYDCYLCKRTLSRKENLVMHMNLMHTGLNLYKCPGCSKSFAQNSDLHKHLNGKRIMCGR